MWCMLDLVTHKIHQTARAMDGLFRMHIYANNMAAHGLCPWLALAGRAPLLRCYRVIMQPAALILLYADILVKSSAIWSHIYWKPGSQ